MRSYPAAGDVYRHNCGHFFTIIRLANVDATRPGWPPTVVYEDRDERVWARPLEEFIKNATRVAPDEENN